MIRSRTLKRELDKWKTEKRMIRKNWSQNQEETEFQEERNKDFPGLRLCSSIARGSGLIPGWGIKIPHAAWPKKTGRKFLELNNNENTTYQLKHFLKKERRKE